MKHLLFTASVAEAAVAAMATPLTKREHLNYFEYDGHYLMPAYIVHDFNLSEELSIREIDCDWVSKFNLERFLPTAKPLHTKGAEPWRDELVLLEKEDLDKFFDNQEKAFKSNYHVTF